MSTKASLTHAQDLLYEKSGSKNRGMSPENSGYVPTFLRTERGGNRVEQLMRQVALGRKNWLFVENVESGERVARLMSVVSIAKRHSI